MPSATGRPLFCLRASSSVSGCDGKKDSDAEWQRLRQALFLRIALSETVVTNKPAVKIEMVRRHTNKQNQQKTLPKEEKLTALISKEISIKGT